MRLAPGGAASGGSYWQPSGTGTTEDSGGDSFSYQGTRQLRRRGGGSGALNQGGSASESFSYTKDYSIGGDGGGNVAWQATGRNRRGHGQRLDLRLLQLRDALSRGPHGDAGTGRLPRRTTRAARTTRPIPSARTALFNGLDWSETGLKTSSGSGSTSDQFSESYDNNGQQESENTSDNVAYNYAEQAYLDDNGVWQYLPSTTGGGAGGEGGGTLSDNAIVRPVDHISVSWATVGFTQNFGPCGSGLYEASSPQTTAQAGSYPGTLRSMSSPLSSGDVTDSLPAQASWPAAVDEVWGMDLTADSATEGWFGAGNTPASTAGFSSETMRGADAVFGSDNVAAVFPVTHSPVLAYAGLNGVSAGNAAGGWQSGNTVSGVPQTTATGTTPATDPLSDLITSISANRAAIQGGVYSGGEGSWQDGLQDGVFRGGGQFVPVCFAAGTQILLADGTTKPIERIERGEEVLAASHQDPEGPLSAGEVVEVYHHEPRSLVRSRLAGI